MSKCCLNPDLAYMGDSEVGWCEGKEFLAEDILSVLDKYRHI